MYIKKGGESSPITESTLWSNETDEEHPKHPQYLLNNKSVRLFINDQNEVMYQFEK